MAIDLDYKLITDPLATVNADRDFNANTTRTKENIKHLASMVRYGTSPTSAATATKVVVTEGGNFVRNVGAIITVKFTYANTHASPTINVDGTGAAAIWDFRTSAPPVVGAMGAATHDFRFNGTQWVLLNPFMQFATNAEAFAGVSTNTIINPYQLVSYVASKELTFIYRCTGTGDSTAIAAIINDFFNNGTAMAMKLTVTGTMGISFSAIYYAIYITAQNTRGAVFTLDLTDCDIPIYTIDSRDFLAIQTTSNNIKMNMIGLVANTTRYAIYIAGVNANINLINCDVFGAIYGVFATSGFSGLLRFLSCMVVGVTNGLQVTSASTATNIIMTDCEIKGETQDINQTTAANTVKWHIKGCQFSKPTIHIDGADITTRDTANVQVALNGFNRTII